MKTLKLTLKKKWFDMILSGEKKEEYREIKKHWTTILYDQFGVFNQYDTVIFRNGYATDAPLIEVECLGVDIDKAVPEWSDNWVGYVYRIKLGTIIRTGNLKTQN